MHVGMLWPLWPKAAKLAEHLLWTHFQASRSAFMLKKLEKFMEVDSSYMLRLGGKPSRMTVFFLKLTHQLLSNG